MRNFRESRGERAGQLDLSDVFPDADGLFGRVEGLHERLARALHEVRRASRDFQQGNDALSIVAERIARADSAIADERERVTALRRDLKAGARERRLLGAQIASLVESLERYERDNAQLIAQRDAAARDAADMRMRARRDAAETAALKTRITSLNEEISALREAIMSGQDNLERLRGDAARREAELKADVAEWLGAAEGLRIELLEMQHALSYRDEALSALEAERDAQNRLITDERAKAAAFDEERAALKEEARHWHGHSEALEAILNSERAERKVEREAHQRAMEALQHAFDSAHERLLRIADHELERTQAEIAHLSHEIDFVQGGRLWRLKRFLRRLMGGS